VTPKSTHAIRPFWGRVAVIDSPVDEIETRSGLIVPVSHGHVGDDHFVPRRAIVQEIDATYGDNPPGQMVELARLLEPGTVVHYYDEGWRIGELVLILPSQIVAYEAHR